MVPLRDYKIIVGVVLFVWSSDIVILERPTTDQHRFVFELETLEIHIDLLRHLRFKLVYLSSPLYEARP